MTTTTTSPLAVVGLPPYRRCSRGKDSVRRIGFAGRYDDPRKNIKLLIDAVAICRESGLDLVLELAGGERAPELESYAHEKGVGEQVAFRGALSELPDFYRSLDVF